MTLCAYMGDGDDGAPTVYAVRDVTARKRHTCCECGGAIHPGDTYRRTNGLWDGAWSTFRTCPACVAGPVGWVLYHCGWHTLGGLRAVLSEWIGDGDAPTPEVEARIRGWVADMDARRAAAHAIGGAA